MSLVTISKKKLASNEGFSLAELLISMVFIGLLCLVIAAGIGAALAAYGNITTQSNANQLLSRSMQEISDELMYATKVESDNSFVSANTNTRVKFENSSEGILLQGEGVGGSGIDSVLLIPAVDNLVATIDQPVYDPKTNCWIYAVTIQNSVSGDRITDQTMTVLKGTSA